MARTAKMRGGTGGGRITATFGLRLIQAAVERGAPPQQERLSQWFKDEHHIEISGAMINRYKNDDSLPRIEKCREFAIALGVTVEWLYTGRGSKYPGPPMTPEEMTAFEALRRIDDIGARTDWLGFIKIAAANHLPPPNYKNNR